MNTDRLLVAFALAVSCLTPGSARGQDPPPPEKPPTLDDSLTAGEALAKDPRRQLVKWNHYEGPNFTLRVGGGLLYEGAWYSQDDESREQFDLVPEGKGRDARLVFKGRFFPKWKREVTYSLGLMYDGPTGEFLLRETGIMVAVPELWGHVFIGRTKEGFSLNKVMVGYSGWTMERATISDATIPILADGIKWLGYLPKQGILWNLGIYTDWLSEGQGFSTYDMQLVGRLAWLPVASEKTGTLLHLGVSGRYGEPNEGELKLRSRPEAFPAEYFVDTGSFASDETKMLAFEGYYRPGPVLVGTEYFVQWANAPEAGDPVFHGGPGAWEAVLRVSYIDLDGGNLSGGRLWRITPMVNWRAEAATMSREGAKRPDGLTCRARHGGGMRNGAHVAPGSRGCVGDAGLRGFTNEVRQSTFGIEVADLERGRRYPGPLAEPTTRGGVTASKWAGLLARQTSAGVHPASPWCGLSQT